MRDLTDTYSESTKIIRVTWHDRCMVANFVLGELEIFMIKENN